MPPSDPQPLSPNAAGAGCGVLAGASAVSLLFFAQALIAPWVGSTVGLDLSGSRWIVASVVAGAIIAAATGFAAARALRQMP